MSRRFVKIDEHVKAIIEYVYTIREHEEELEEREENSRGKSKSQFFNIFDRLGGYGGSTYRAMARARSGKTKWLSVGNFDRILCAIERPELIHYFKEYTVTPKGSKEHTDIETWDIPEGGII